MKDYNKRLEEYNSKKLNLIKELKENRKSGDIGLSKKTSNLFRTRNQNNTKKINVKNFNNVINVDVEKLICEVEGMCTYERLVDRCLEYGVMPTVVPELKSITIGGAATGVGIESSSFKFGLVHETILELEILLSNGKIVVATSDNKYKDLFFAFPNSYGTLGYALKIKVKVVPVKKYVKLEHLKFNIDKDYFEAVKKYCLENKKDFVDGVVFSENEMYVTLGEFVDEAPFISNYKYLNIYYKSIKKNKDDFLTVKDYIWRWDTDWFWCSKHFFAQNKIIRLLFGKFLLKSTTYWKIMFWNRKYKLSEKIESLFGKKSYTESVIQDVEIPIENCGKFLEFFHSKIGIKPVWICPVKHYDNKHTFTLYPLQKNKLYVNFGFWDVVKSEKDMGEGYFNKLIEAKVRELNGKKSLYSTSYYSEKGFWQLFNKKEYDKLKKKYDPSKIFKNLYEKCVKRD